MLADDFPILGIFSTAAFAAFWAALLGMIFWAFADILRNPNISGVAKAFWVLIVVWIPFLGIVIYVVDREHATNEADFAKAREATRLRNEAKSST
jgi:TRAP-type C4-dicarboxylate transport system permease small subunit